MVEYLIDGSDDRFFLTEFIKEKAVLRVADPFPKAQGLFQKKVGMEVTGIADADTQIALFSETAPRK